jgi:peptidyl-prolyl cis-trans isomerase D
MLQQIRERSQGLVMGVIVFFICLTFALFGVQQYLDAQSSVVVAEVNGEEVPLTEFQRAFTQLRQRAQAMFGDAFDPNIWGGEAAKLNALDYVVDERVLLQVVDDANIRASDLQVANYIRTSPQFVDGETFSPSLYKQMIRSIGFSEIGFEQQVRKDLVVNQLRAGIAATAFVTAEELQRLETFRQQKRDIGFALIGIEAFRDAVNPSPEELVGYFEKNIENYRIPEKISLAYIDLSIEKLMTDVPTDDARLRAYYDANVGNYTATEQRNANHILVQLPRDASDDEVNNAQEKALKLREQALNGADFETIARENSDDIGSRTDGGETGFFGRGVMAPEFEEAVFSMDEQAISEPIRTEFGFHIIRLKAIKPGGIKSFDEVKADVTETYRREQAEALFFEQAEQLAELVYEQPDSLEPAAGTLGLEVQQTGLLTRQEVADLFAAAVTEAAFEPEVLVEGLNSEPVDVSNGRVVVVRSLLHETSRLPELGMVEAEVRKNFVDASAREAITARGDALVERLNNGENRDALLKEADIRWEEVPGATRDSAKLNRAVLREAFRADPPEGDSTAYKGFAIGIGDYAIVGISNVELPPIEQLNVSDISQLRRDVAGDRTAVAWRDFVEILKSDAAIDLYPERL